LEQLLTLPFLQEFYRLAYKADLRDWFVAPSIARELLEVAPSYLRAEKEGDSSDILTANWVRVILVEGSRPNNEATCRQILYTFQHAWWWTYRYKFGRTVYLHEYEQRQTLIPGFGPCVYDEDQQERYKEYRKAFTSEYPHGDYFVFDNDLYPGIDCRICGEPCLVSAEGNLYEENGEQFLNAVAVHCPGCGLDINRKLFPSSLLATLHIGPITKEILGEKRWNEVLGDLS
jgi:hypothetical protein